MYLKSISVVFCPVMTNAFNDCWKCDFFITKGLHKKIVRLFVCVKPGHTAWLVKQSSSCVL